MIIQSFGHTNCPSCTYKDYFTIYIYICVHIYILYSITHYSRKRYCDIYHKLWYLNTIRAIINHIYVYWYNLLWPLTSVVNLKHHAFDIPVTQVNCCFLFVYEIKNIIFLIFFILVIYIENIIFYSNDVIILIQILVLHDSIKNILL